MALTAKQQNFTNEYLIDFNGTRAAERAGYSGNDNTLAVTAHDLLRNPKVAEVISKRLSESAMSADEALMRLAMQARGDMADFVRTNDNGDVTVDLSQVVENGKSALIKKLTQRRVIRSKDDETTEDVTTSIELYDAHAALVDIGRHHILFTDKTEQDNTGEVTVRVIYDDTDINA